MRRAAWLDFWVGLAFTAVLIVLKIVVEHGTFGRQIEQMTLNLQQLRLAGAASVARPPVVIDITDVPRVPRDQSADLELVTDRRRLIDLVAAAALRDPAAIGVDVLLDPPTPDAPLTPDEVQLLEFCLDVRNSRGERIPTVVGIFDGAARGPARWLGEPRFGDLAAYVLVPKPDADAATTSMIHAVDVETTGGPARIRSLAQALADVVNARDETRWSLGRRIVDRFQLLVKRDRPVTRTSFATSEFAVNFGVVPRLRETTIRAAVPADIERSPVALRDRVVLLGRAETGRTTDVFTVPTQAEPLAGVYVHAAAVYTLTDAPLFRPTHAGRIVADVVAALVPLGFVLFVRLRRSRRPMDDAGAHTLTRRLTLGTAALVFLCGYFWVTYTGVLWTDYLMVIAALLLHGPIERTSLRLLRRATGGAVSAHGEGH